MKSKCACGPVRFHTSAKAETFVHTCLDDELGALVAGEQSHVHDAAFHVGTVLVHDGVQLSMTHCNRSVQHLKSREMLI